MRQSLYLCHMLFFFPFCIFWPMYSLDSFMSTCNYSKLFGLICLSLFFFNHWTDVSTSLIYKTIFFFSPPFFLFSGSWLQHSRFQHWSFKLSTVEMTSWPEGSQRLKCLFSKSRKNKNISQSKIMTIHLVILDNKECPKNALLEISQQENKTQTNSTLLFEAKHYASK